MLVNTNICIKEGDPVANLRNADYDDLRLLQVHRGLYSVLPDGFSGKKLTMMMNVIVSQKSGEQHCTPQGRPMG
jgi:hypothetical protein